MSTCTVDGALSLTEQNQTLEFEQQQQGSKLSSYDKDNVQTQNVATFQELPMGEDVPTLTLVAVPAGQNRRRQVKGTICSSTIKDFLKRRSMTLTISTT